MCMYDNVERIYNRMIVVVRNYSFALSTSILTLELVISFHYTFVNGRVVSG